MAWAAAGSVLAVCSYVLLFPVFESPARTMTAMAMAIVAVLAIAARGSNRAMRILWRMPGPTALLPPLVLSIATSAVLGGGGEPLALAHEAAASALLVSMSAICASESAQQPPPSRGTLMREI